MRNQERQQSSATDVLGETLPLSAMHQLDEITRSLCEAIAENMMGIYLHGSLAMGCFNTESSDIDLLVVTQTPLDSASQRAIVIALLAYSSQPHPIEISVVHYAQIASWRHPAPYDFHFSEIHRSVCAQLLSDPNATLPAGGNDPDLAAHFTVLAARGVCLHGAPINELPIDVPWDDYVASLRSDFEWSQAPGNADATYAVLNGCRIWAAIADRRVLSKAEGAQWALERIPTQFDVTIRLAAARYAAIDVGTMPELTKKELGAFLTWIRKQLGW
ncbi:MAG: DUF4111 domain-containing protein [Caldilinea sp.]